MNLTLLIIMMILVSVVFYGITLYNQLISLKNAVLKNWSNIDVLLKQRNTELTKLLQTCKEYMQYEQSTLEKIVQTRGSLTAATDSNDLAALGQAETALRTHLHRLFALAENYPDLKTNTVFLELQQRISDLESSISDRRELYNESVNYNNVAIAQFPTVIIARAFHFKSCDLLEFSQAEKEDVDVKKHFEN